MTSQPNLAMNTAATGTLPDVSLVLGGPLFRLLRRSHLSGDALELLRRRILVITLVAWLPLLLLSVFGDRDLAGTIKIDFLHDIEAHARFLIALPALIAAELLVHTRLSAVVRRFVERGVVVAEDLPKFNQAVKSVLRLRDSVAMEIALLVLIYPLGHWIWQSQVASGSATWYATPYPMHLHLSRAGYWYAFVSIPIFQFLLLRWYMRLLLWFWLLFKISKLNLRLTAAHPDRAGGIAFLGKSSYAFAPILFAQGVVLAGLIANRILYEGQSLLSFKIEAAGSIGFFVMFILGPLLMFSPQLARTKRSGRAEYGLLASRYVFGFDQKWIRSGSPDSGELLGTPDLQSLADLANSYSVVRGMRIVPFSVDDITTLAFATGAPLIPLSLTVLSPDELLIHVVKILFR